MHRILAPLLLAFAAHTVHGAEAPPTIDVAALAISQQTFTLANGLRVVVHEDHSVPLVAVNLWYHVGSRNERRGRTGFAHLFEHFFFNGSEHYPHGFREAMDDLGATNRNGTTSTDRTNFFEDVPVSALERTLYLEADRMGWLAGNLSEAMLERERGVVQNEKRQGENQPYGRVFERMVETMYPYSHPYSWSTIGSMEDLNAATLTDIKDWYSAWYGPNNAVLVLAGDITLARAKELVGKYFGGVPAGAPVTRLEAWVPTLDADVRETMQERVPQTRIYRSWHLPPLGERELHAMELFASVLSGSESAPLDRRLVFERQLATSVSAYVLPLETTSLFGVQLTLKDGVDPALAEREFDTVLAELLATPPAAKDLDRARTRLLAEFARGIERLGGFGGRSDVLAQSLTYFDDADAYQRRLRDLTTIDGANLTSTARAWLGRHHYTLQVQPFAARAADQDSIDRRQLPALAPAPDVRFPEVQRATLANGLELVLLERHSAPLVSMALAIDAGSAADAADARGSGRLAVDLLLKGTRTRSAFEIADQRDALGAQLDVTHALDQSLLQMRALKPTLKPSLALFADVARNPVFAPDMIEVQRKQQLAAIAQQQANPITAALAVAQPLLFGATHPYAQAPGGLGDVAVVEALPRDALVAWHRRWFVPEHASLVVAGDITLAELIELAQQHFGDWQAHGTTHDKTPAAMPAANARGKVYLIDKPDAPQSVIYAAHVAESGAGVDDLALETVMRNFGGMATSRLNRNLRLDKHWSYGTAGSVSSARGPRLFSVMAPVQTDKTRDAMLEVKKEIDGVAGARPLAGAELDSILRSQLSRLPGRYETLNDLLGAGLDIVNLGRDPAYYTGYANNLRALDAATLNRVAARVVRADALTWIIVGDLGKIEAGVRELEFGEVIVVGARGSD